jgi:hypothetical protein
LPPELPNRIYVRGETRTPDLCLRSAALSFPTELHGQQTAGAGLEPATSDLTGRRSAD